MCGAIKYDPCGILSDCGDDGRGWQGAARGATRLYLLYVLRVAVLC